MMPSIAIYGCGAVAELLYAKPLRRLSDEGWEVICVDHARERAQQIAALVRGEAAEPTRSKRGLDAAIVATPPASHARLVRELIESSVDVLCEKPFVVDPREGWELVSLAEKDRRTLVVNQTRRFQPNAILARDLVKSGAIGTLRDIEVREGVKFEWATRTAFHFDTKSSKTGILSDQGAHVFDLIAWIAGHPIAPTFVATDGYRGPEATAFVEFSAVGFTGSALLTWLVRLPPRLVLRGDAGSIELEENPNMLFVTTGGRRKPMWATDPTSGYDELVARVVRDFLAARTGGSSSSTARSVVPSIEFLDAAYAMAKPSWPLPEVLA